MPLQYQAVRVEVATQARAELFTILSAHMQHVFFCVGKVADWQTLGICCNIVVLLASRLAQAEALKRRKQLRLIWYVGKTYAFPRANCLPMMVHFNALTLVNP